MRLLKLLNSPYFYKSKYTHAHQYGFAVPALMLFIAAFLLIPVGFWLAGAKKTFSVQVKGIETESQPGVNLQLVSKTGSWDLYKYACKTREECENGLYEGKKLESTHGGATEGSNVPISYTSSLKDYAYLKIFVKESKSPVDSGYFYVVDGSESDLASILTLDSVQVILINLQSLQNAAQTSFVLTNE